MENFQLNSELELEIKKKLDEHIKQIIEKPTISIEERGVLEFELEKYKELEEKLRDDKNDFSGAWLSVILFMLLSGFGGDKHGV